MGDSIDRGILVVGDTYFKGLWRPLAFQLGDYVLQEVSLRFGHFPIY